MMLEVRRKGIKSDAVRFDKGRGADAQAQLLRYEEIESVKNGGSYLDIVVKSEIGEGLRLRAGDYVVFDKVEGVLVYSTEEFNKLFNVNK